MKVLVEPIIAPSGLGILYDTGALYAASPCHKKYLYRNGNSYWDGSTERNWPSWYCSECDTEVERTVQHINGGFFLNSYATEELVRAWVSEWTKFPEERLEIKVSR